MEYDVLCPMLKRNIDNGYCYEITTAAYGMLKMDILEDKIERDVACKCCNSCKYNQIKDIRSKND